MTTIDEIKAQKALLFPQMWDAKLGKFVIYHRCDYEPIPRCRHDAGRVCGRSLGRPCSPKHANAETATPAGFNTIADVEDLLVDSRTKQAETPYLGVGYALPWNVPATIRRIDDEGRLVGDFVETFRSGAFREQLSNPLHKVRLFVNHVRDAFPLADTEDGSLRILGDDPTGLRFMCDLTETQARCVRDCVGVSISFVEDRDETEVINTQGYQRLNEHRIYKGRITEISLILPPNRPAHRTLFRVYPQNSGNALQRRRSTVALRHGYWTPRSVADYAATMKRDLNLS